MDRRERERIEAAGARLIQVFVLGGSLAGWVSLGLLLWGLHG